MPAYGTPQSGYNGPPDQGLNLTSLNPGDGPLVLFDGTETPALNLASIAFSRGPSLGGGDNGCTFNLRGVPSGMTVDVQVSQTGANGDYTTVATLSPDANGNTAYTDTGRSPFYRYQISAYTTGTMPVCTVSR